MKKVFLNGSSIKKHAVRDRSANGRFAITVKRPFNMTPFILAVTAVAFALPLVVMLGIRTDTAIAEWWTRNIQAGWERAVGTLTSWLPFSVFEFFVTAGIIVGVYLLVRLFVNLCAGRFRRVITGALAVSIGAVYILNVYVLSMGFGYYRTVMPIPQAGRDYDKARLTSVIEYFVDDYNALALAFERDDNGCAVCPYTFAELSNLIADEYSRLDGTYFARYTPKAKPVVNSWLLSDMLITGITFLPFGEATVNTVAPPSEMTLTMAHELAHTKGVQREGDANLLARYVLLNSDNDYLRYCGYYGAFYNLVSAVMLFDDRDEYRRLVNKLDPAIGAENNYARVYWNSQPDIVGKIAQGFNDLYLKLSGALNGVGSYGDGNKSDVIISTDPDTGEEVKKIYYSQTQMLFFALYEQRTA